MPNDVPATAVVARRESPKDQYLALESLIRQKEDAIVATLAPTISRDRFISVSLTNTRIVRMFAPVTKNIAAASCTA